MAMRALGFEPKKEEIKKMISDIDKVCTMWLSTSFFECCTYLPNKCIGWVGYHRFFRVPRDDDCEDERTRLSGGDIESIQTV